MLKKFLTVILPLVLPVVIYWVYLILARRKARLKAEGNLPGWQDAPWSWIIVAGVLLMAGALFYVRANSGVERVEPEQPSAASVAPAMTSEAAPTSE